MYLCVPDISWFYWNTASINVRTPSRKPPKKMWGHQSSGARAPKLWCPLCSWLSKKSTEKTNKDYFVKLNLFKNVQLLTEEVMFFKFCTSRTRTLPLWSFIKASFFFTIYSGSSCTERCPGDLRGCDFFYSYRVFSSESEWIEWSRQNSPTKRTMSFL